MTTVLVLFLLGFIKYTYDLKIQTQQAEAARLVAEQAKEESDKVAEFLENLFMVSNPYQQKGKDITARELLDEGAKRIDAELSNQPNVLLHLKTVIGHVFLQLGLNDSARKQFDESEHLIAENNIKNNELKRKLKEYQASLEIKDSHLTKAEKILKSLLKQMQQSKNYKQQKYLDRRYDLGVVEYKLGKYDEAKNIYNTLLKVYEKAPENYSLKIIQLNNSLGLLYSSLEKYAQAKSHLLKALSLPYPKGAQSLEVKITVLNNLSNVYSDIGDYKNALKYGLQSLKIKQNILPKHHPNLALSYDNLSIIYYQLENREKSKEFNDKALDIYAKSLGENSIDYAYALGNRVAIFILDKDWQGAAKVIQQELSILQNIYGKNHVDIAYALKNLGNIYFYHIHNYQQASVELGKAIVMYMALDFPLTQSIVTLYKNLASSQEKNQNHKGALQTYQELLNRLENSSDTELKNKNLAVIQSILKTINQIKN